MVHNEQWEHWIPCKDLVARYHVNSVIENNEGLSILLEEDRNSHRGIKMSFGYAADAYRSTYETMCHMQIIELDRIYGQEFYTKWSFFIVKNSQYAEWLQKNSGGIAQPNDYTHFAILTPDLIVDVLASQEPIIHQHIFNEKI